MFDEPIQRGSRLPESPRINSLLAGLMGSAPTAKPQPQPTLIPAEPEPEPRSVLGRSLGNFFKSIPWAYVPTVESRIVVTPAMATREFFSVINWRGEKNPSPASFGGSAVPPSVENLMSQFSWD